MFLLVSGRHVGGHTDGHQYGVSIQISINLGKKIIRISRVRKIAVIRNLARVFAYLPSFISQILDFIYRPVVIFILIYFELRDTENQQSLLSLQRYSSFWNMQISQVIDQMWWRKISQPICIRNVWFFCSKIQFCHYGNILGSRSPQYLRLSGHLWRSI